MRQEARGKRQERSGKKLKDVGEFNLIEMFRRHTKKGKDVRLGIGDDAAVIRFGGKTLLFTTDMLIEGRHFRQQDATAFEIGRKAMAVNLSDIAAMGGLPRHAVVSVGLPSSLGVDYAKALYHGMQTVGRQYGASVVGGDTNESDNIVLSVALTGEAPDGRYVTRSGARPGDVIFVTGALGGTYASKKHLNFTPRFKEAQFLIRHFKIHSMMDLSDGLASDIRRIAAESGVGACLSYGAIPVAPEARGMDDALGGGEDFELLFTLSPHEAARLTLYPSKKGLARFVPVGKILRKRCGLMMMRPNGEVERLPEKGFHHFNE